MAKTLSYTQDLERAGFERKQAEGIIKSQYELIKENVATKDDIVRLSSEIKVLEAKFETKFTTLESKFENLETKFDGLEDKMTIKLGSIMAIGIGIIIALGYF